MSWIPPSFPPPQNPGPPVIKTVDPAGVLWPKTIHLFAERCNQGSNLILDKLLIFLSKDNWSISGLSVWRVSDHWNSTWVDLLCLFMRKRYDTLAFLLYTTIWMREFEVNRETTKRIWQKREQSRSLWHPMLIYTTQKMSVYWYANSIFFK